MDMGLGTLMPQTWAMLLTQIWKFCCKGKNNDKG